MREDGLLSPRVEIRLWSCAVDFLCKSLFAFRSVWVWLEKVKMIGSTPTDTCPPGRQRFWCRLLFCLSVPRPVWVWCVILLSAENISWCKKKGERAEACEASWVIGWGCSAWYAIIHLFFVYDHFRFKDLNACVVGVGTWDWKPVYDLNICYCILVELKIERVVFIHLFLGNIR